MKQSRRVTLLDRVNALDARLKSLRQQQDRIKRQKTQIKLQKAKQVLVSHDRSA